MDWTQVFKFLLAVLPSISSLIDNILAAENPVDSKAQGERHIQQLTACLADLNGPGAMRLLPPEVGSAVRDSLRAVAHAHMGLLRAVMNHQDEIRGAFKNMADLAAETKDTKPSQDANVGQRPAPAAPSSDELVGKVVDLVLAKLAEKAPPKAE